MHSVQSICTTFFEIYLPVKSSVLFYDPLISRPIISFILAISSSFSIGFRIKLLAGCDRSVLTLVSHLYNASDNQIKSSIADT
jgi:hypothetical protein